MTRSPAPRPQAASGRHDDALRLARLARELEPLSPVVNMGIPWALHFADRREEALIESRRVEELSPGFEEAGNLQIASLESLGRFEQAAAIMKRQMCWGLPVDGDALARAAQAGGKAAYWKARLDTLLPLPETPSGTREYQIALSLGQLGRLDEAIASLQRCVHLRAGMCVFMQIDPNLKAIRQHPGFAALVEQVGVGR